ncbi:MAG: tyrosine-type recombinase/integrase, partial [Solirubrobacteraceae bacterium]
VCRKGCGASVRLWGGAAGEKAPPLTDIDRGDYEGRSRLTLREYATEWVERYQGTGRRGFRDETRDEYRVLLTNYALKFFPAQKLLKELSPSDIADLIGWLVKQPNGRGSTLTDKSVRNALGPLRACLASAKREGKINANPASGAALPHRPRIEEDEELPRPFPRLDEVETMELVVALVHQDHHLMFELLAATGLRRSELLALETRHLELDSAEPFVRVRQRTRWQKGKGQVIGPLKSCHARRDLPIPLDVADRLRSHVAGKDDAALVFPGHGGRPYDPHHLTLRVLGPACAEAGVEWAGFHTFRHTIASRMFAAGRNAVQVQHWLGHHSAAFTLQRYVHLLDGDLGGPVEPKGVNRVRTEPTPLDDTAIEGLE